MCSEPRTPSPVGELSSSVEKKVVSVGVISRRPPSKEGVLYTDVSELRSFPGQLGLQTMSALVVWSPTSSHIKYIPGIA